MASNEFNFSVAEQLTDAITNTSKEIENINNEVISSFKDLNEYFRDDRYEEYSRDMNAANKAIDEITVQMKTIAKKIWEYARDLEGVV